MLQSKCQPDLPQRGRFCPENRCRAERSDHLIVAHVKQPHVPFVPGALLRDGQNGVGIDGGHRHANDLEVRLGKPLPQQHLEIAAESERGRGIPQRRRLAQQKDPIAARWFHCPHDNRCRAAGHLRREESKAEPGILDQTIDPVDGGLLKKCGAPARAGDPQQKFHGAEQHERDQREREQAKEPHPPFLHGRAGRGCCRSRPGGRSRITLGRYVRGVIHGRHVSSPGLRRKVKPWDETGAYL